MRLRFLPTLVALLLAASPAAAEEAPATADPAALAQEAHQVLSAHCAEAAGGAMTAAAESVAVVSNLWARISAAVESHPEGYLLYWRGVLAQCLSQEERALQDLQTFVEIRADSDAWPDLLVDARKRNRRIERRLGKSTLASIKPGEVVGVGFGAALAVASVASAIVSASRWQGALDHAAAMYQDKYITQSDYDDNFAQGEQLFDSHFAPAGVAIGCGIGSAIAFTITLLSSRSKPSASVRAPLLAPTRSGAVLLWEGRW